MPKPKKRRKKSNPVGRPTLLTPELSKKICSYIMAGAFGHAAAEACGISNFTYQEWMRRGEDRENRRESNAAYAQFAQDIRHARANARISAEITIKTASPEWWLPRMYRQDWGNPPTQVEVNGIGAGLNAEEFSKMFERLNYQQREIFLALWQIMQGHVPAERPAIETSAEQKE